MNTTPDRAGEYYNRKWAHISCHWWGGHHFNEGRCVVCGKSEEAKINKKERKK